MISVPFVFKILLSIFLPLWLYVWINRTVKKYNTSCLDLKQNIPSKYLLLIHIDKIGMHIHYQKLLLGTYFLLKYWWAEYCINKIKKKKGHSDYEKSHLENSKIKDKNVSIFSFIKLGRVIKFIQNDFYLFRVPTAYYFMVQIKKGIL